MGESCVFCDIIEGRTSAKVVRTWADAICIVPLNPVTPGHLLVLPKRHVQTIFSDPDTSADTMRRVAEMLHGVERHHDPNDYNVITSAGEAATQTIWHLHVHLVPRKHGDGLALPWTVPPTDIFTEIKAERARAHAKHGDTSMESSAPDTLRRLAILAEEVGEVAREFNDAEHDGRPVDLAKLRRELIQTAAMAAAWADAIDGWAVLDA